MVASRSIVSRTRLRCLCRGRVSRARRRRRAALCLLGQPDTAASWKRRSKRKRLPALLQLGPDGYPWHPRATNSAARDVLARLDAGALRQHLALGWKQIPSRGLRGALPSPPQAWGTCFSPPVAAAGAAGAGPLVISAQNDLAVGSRRPKRRWEAATHRKRVPAQRKAAAERQPSGTADS